jgi:hypothetical protein
MKKDKPTSRSKKWRSSPGRACATKGRFSQGKGSGAVRGSPQNNQPYYEEASYGRTIARG